MSSSHDPLYIEFVANLRRLRKNQGMSQSDLAIRIGRDQTFVSKVESCERRLDVIEASKWCIELGVRLEDALPAQLRRHWES